MRRILAKGSAYSRTQLMGTILQYARFEDIWKYLSGRDVQKYFWQIPWRDAAVCDHWKWALTLWGYPPDEEVFSRVMAELRRSARWTQ